MIWHCFSGALGPELSPCCATPSWSLKARQAIRFCISAPGQHKRTGQRCHSLKTCHQAAILVTYALQPPSCNVRLAALRLKWSQSAPHVSLARIHSLAHHALVPFSLGAALPFSLAAPCTLSLDASSPALFWNTCTQAVSFSCGLTESLTEWSFCC